MTDCLLSDCTYTILQGETVEESSLNFGVNKAGFMLHSALHAARPDIKCIIHLHTPNIVAVSYRKDPFDCSHGSRSRNSR